MATVRDVLARALSATGRGTLYWAGTGGFDPAAPTPAQALAVGREWPRLPPDQQAALLPLAQTAGLDPTDPALVAPACDCSGFVCWALGIPRRVPVPGGGAEWVNTDSIWQDAVGAGRRFRRIPQARPGCLVVYPQAGSGERYGHVGLVVGTDAAGRAARIAHCSAANFAAAPHDAILANAAEAFGRQPRTIHAWFRGVDA